MPRALNASSSVSIIAVAVAGEGIIGRTRLVRPSTDYYLVVQVSKRDRYPAASICHSLTTRGYGPCSSELGPVVDLSVNSLFCLFVPSRLFVAYLSHP